MMCRSGLSLSLLSILAFTVHTSEANYNFTVRFYEFRNPLGLQCGECKNGGPPACCDDVNRTENCVNENQEEGPRRCDTRFRFILRPFGASMKTAPSGRFPHFTHSNGGNSDTFNEGGGGFLALPNPFTINSTMNWTGRIQFFIDALDKNVRSNETEALINRFPINLELELGADFTERATYTGIYNISDLGFDMSFRVQCSENYYGPNCTECVLYGYDPVLNCATCLPDFIRMGSNCSRRVESTEEMISAVTTDHRGVTSRSADTPRLPHDMDGGLNLALVGGVAGGVLAALVVIIILILCILVVVIQKRKRTKYDAADAASCLSVDDPSTYTKKTTSGRSNTPQHDFKNPLYGPTSTPPATAGTTNGATAGTTNGEQYPLEQLLEVPNPFYGEFTDSTSQVGSKRGSRTSLNKEDATSPRSRLDTFPYEMDRADDAVSTASTLNRQQRERIEPIVYEMADVVSGKPSMKVENSMYDTADNVCGEPSKAINNMYDTADNICGKPSKIENNMYDTADNVCGRPVSADNGVSLGAEYDDIKTGGASAATYDDIVVPSGKKSAGVNKVNGDNMSAAVYDDILTSNRDIKVATETQALYDDIVKTSKSPSVPTATGNNDEYDDVIKGPGQPSSAGTAAKLMSDSGEGAQPFDNEVYSAPYPPPNS